jgi:hypothetical protein
VRREGRGTSQAPPAKPVKVGAPFMVIHFLVINDILKQYMYMKTKQNEAFIHQEVLYRVELHDMIFPISALKLEHTFVL